MRKWGFTHSKIIALVHFRWHVFVPDSNHSGQFIFKSIVKACLFLCYVENFLGKALDTKFHLHRAKGLFVCIFASIYVTVTIFHTHTFLNYSMLNNDLKCK